MADIDGNVLVLSRFAKCLLGLSGYDFVFATFRMLLILIGYNYSMFLSLIGAF